MTAVARILKLPALDGGEGNNRQALGRALVTTALRGDTAALKLLLERIDGPVVKQVEHGVSTRLIVQRAAQPTIIEAAPTPSPLLSVRVEEGGDNVALTAGGQGEQGAAQDASSR